MVICHYFGDVAEWRGMAVKRKARMVADYCATAHAVIRSL